MWLPLPQWLSGNFDNMHYNPTEADLIFLLSDGTPFSKAIVACSAPQMLLDHVGIIHHTPYGMEVIEAHHRLGVVSTPIHEFIARAPENEYGKGWLIRQVPDDAGLDLKQAIARARGFIGYAYNERFVPTPGALYCSELVQQCFLKENLSPFFSDIAMSFAADNSFWSDHFARLGMKVPEGQPGTSPLSIYNQTCDKRQDK